MFIIVYTSESGAEKILNNAEITMVDMIGERVRITTTSGNSLIVKESMEAMKELLNVSSGVTRKVAVKRKAKRSSVNGRN